MSSDVGQPFSEEQKQYLQGFMTGVIQKGVPFVGATPGGLITSDPALAVGGTATQPEESVFGTPVDDLCREELTKLRENPLDIWEKMVRYAEDGQFPEGDDIFRWKFHGLFFVAPAQQAFMCRLRLPACQVTAHQMRGLAALAENCGAGHADVTTRGNLQIREIGAAKAIDMLEGLYDLGLTARGAGADNIRNITGTASSGFDPQELIDVRPLARSLHHYILNHRDLYGLPRKFNVAFDSGGSMTVAADTNDIGFRAVMVGSKQKKYDPGVYFRLELGGISGHQTVAQDTGLLLQPRDLLAVAVAMIRVFNENGDRTNRKKARLKYLLEKWGIPKFLEETQKKLAFPLQYAPLGICEPRKPQIKHAHVGLHAQKEAGKFYVGVVLPVGRMTSSQMRALADLADQYGKAELRLTVYQNVLIPHVCEENLRAVTEALLATGLDFRASSAMGGMVACTGNQGCKYAATNTKGQALELGRYLDARLQLDQPINIHVTGCPHSCAQHYVGDIGLQGVKVAVGDEQVEGYDVVFGGGMDHESGIGQLALRAIPFADLLPMLESVLRHYQCARHGEETFVEFTRRHNPEQLSAMAMAREGVLQ